NQDRGRCHGCSHVSDEHGAFYWPIARVFCVYHPTGTSSRPREARSWLSHVTAGSARHQIIERSRTVAVSERPFAPGVHQFPCHKAPIAQLGYPPFRGDFLCFATTFFL